MSEVVALLVKPIYGLGGIILARSSSYPALKFVVMVVIVGVDADGKLGRVITLFIPSPLQLVVLRGFLPKE